MNFARCPTLLKHATTIALALGAVALLIRLAFLGSFPPGLHHDEAWNGIDALNISLRFHPVFFPNSNGREPLFLYLQAISMALFGPTPAALRGVSAIAGAATVVVTVYLARAMTRNLVVGALAGFFTAFSFWHLLDSRLGYRAILQPLCMSAAILVLWIAWHPNQESLTDGDAAADSTRSSRRLVLLFIGGLLIGVSAYTYIAARVFPGVLALWFCWRICTAGRRRVVRELSEWLAVATIPVIVAAPLGLYFWRHPDEFFGRSSQVSVFTPPASSYDAVTGPWSSTLRTLGMFSVQGDPLWKFNIGSKPVFDWPLAALFYGGLGMAAWAVMRGVLRGQQRRPDPSDTPTLSAEAGWLLLVWVAVMLVPGFLSTESPYYYRTIGIIPAIFIVPAGAIVAALRAAPRLVRNDAMRKHLRRSLLAAAGVLLAFEAVSTCVNYFVLWAPTQPAYYDLHGEAADMARALRNLPPEDPVVIATDYYQHPTIRFLAPRQAADATWIRGTEAFVIPPGAGMAVYALQGKVEPDFLNLDNVFIGHPPVALGKDFAHDEAYRIYRAPASAVTLPSPATSLNLDLGGVVHLIGYTIVPQSEKTPDIVGVLLFWSPLQASTRKISIFTHLEDSSGHKWAQRDNIGYFSPDWNPGARVVTYHAIAVPPGTPPVSMRVLAGFYYLDDLSKLTAANVPADQQQQGLQLGPVLVRSVAETLRTSNNAAGRPSQPLGQSGVVFEGSSPLPPTIRQDADLDVTLYVRVSGPLPPGDHIRLALIDSSGNPAQSSDSVPVATDYPPSRWSAGLVAENHQLHVGARSEPGPKTLIAAIVDQLGNTVGAKTGVANAGAITITPLDRSFSAPSSAIKSGYTLGDAITLDGLTLANQSPQPGSLLDVILDWKDVRPVDIRYTVFVHLVDATGKLRGQHDGPPSAGVWPTTSWLPGQYVVDRHAVPIDAGAPSGVYHIEIGLYDPLTGKRLAVTAPDGRPAGDHITIDGLRVGASVP